MALIDSALAGFFIHHRVAARRDGLNIDRLQIGRAVGERIWTAPTDGYFDGITTHDGSIIIAHPGCTRVENGTTVTGRAAGTHGATHPVLV